MPYPFNGEFFDYESPDAPVLGSFNGEDILLHLPPELKVSQLKWLSVWCRAFTVNFGDLIFPSEEGDKSDNEGQSKDGCSYKALL